MRASRRPSDFVTFVQFCYYHQEKTVARTGETTKNVERTVFKKFDEKFPGLAIDELDTEKLDEFYGYLLKTLHNNLNTAGKNMVVLRKYAIAAFKAGYLDENPFDNWSIRKGSPSVVYLTEEEVEMMMDYYIEGDLDVTAYRTLEVFLFLCFSSLHIGDAKRLMLEQFTGETFTYFRKKLETRLPKPIVVPVSAPLRQIMRNMVGMRKKGAVLVDIPTEQEMNRTLKVICKTLRIEKNVTLKVARHTFATIFLRKTKDLATLKEIMGHEEFKETMIYAHVMSEAKVEGVESAFGGFSFRGPVGCAVGTLGG